MILFLSFFLCWGNASCTTEYIYPIGIVPQSSQTKILLMHQDTQRHMHVYLWDSVARLYEPALSSQYNPIEVQPLPNGTGFSFIDNGIVKIKLFNRRSAKIIEIYEPLYHISHLVWISDRQFLFQAKRGDRYGIYQSDIDGIVVQIKTDSSHDYGYPAYIQNNLFYISRDLSDTYYVVQISQANQEETILYTSARPITSLAMLSSDDGYFLEKTAAGFDLRLFRKNEYGITFEDMKDLTENACLFFDNNGSLCEIFMPFLPKSEGTRVFLPWGNKNSSGDLLYYDTIKHCVARRNFSSFFFPPTLKSDVQFSFFGCPLMVQNETFIGLAIKS